jgi:PPE-repeat protein
MPDPTWPSSPPEINYLRLVGPGAAGTGTTLASAAAWQALMASNEAAASVSSVNTAATALNFEGLSGTASAATATGLNTSLHLLAGWAQEKAPIAASAVSAYETAVSAMIPAEVSMANRTAQAADVAMNPMVLGALTPAIVALDTEYFGEFWPHNAGAGAAYGSALAALVPALVVPPPLAPPGASPAAPAAAAAAVTQAAGETTGQEALKQSGRAAELLTGGAGSSTEQIGQMASTMMQPLQSAMQPLMGMFQAPVQAFQGLSSLPQSMMGQLGGLSQAGIAPEAQIPAAMLAAAGGPGAGLAGAAGSVGAGTGAASLGGAVSAGAGGLGGGVGAPAAALTSFTRPVSSFAPEGGGRPAGLPGGLLSASELRSPTTSVAGGPMPISPAQAGMLGHGRGENTRDEVALARIVLKSDRDASGSPT